MKPSYLDLAAPGPREGFLERFAHARPGRWARRVVEAEVVDPGVDGAGAVDLVRPLVVDLHAHVLEEREDVGEQDRLPRAEQLEDEEVVLGLERAVERELEVALRVELLHPLDVEDSRRRREVVAVGGREGVAVRREQLGALLLAELVDQGVLEVVRPGARRLDQALLDLAHVEVRQRPRLGVDDVVEARQDGLGQADVPVDAVAAEDLAEDLARSPRGPGC